MTTIQIAASTVTTATPDDVWAVLDDFAGWPQWMPAMQSITVETPANETPHLGYRFMLRSGLVQTQMEVVEYAPLARTTTFQVSFPPLQGTNSCRLIPLDDGRYRIERVDALAIPEPLANLLLATQRKRFERLASEFVLALKRAVEERANLAHP
jgi:carbon monoxide dehydrogenase subunit G